MGFFSNLFKAVTQPVVKVAAQVDTTVHAVTQTADHVVKSVGSVVATVPVAGHVADQFVFQSDLATDLADTSSSVFSTTTALSMVTGGAVLSLDGALASDAISANIDIFGQQIDLSGQTVHSSLTSIFDFG